MAGPQHQRRRGERASTPGPDVLALPSRNQDEQPELLSRLRRRGCGAVSSVLWLATIVSALSTVASAATSPSDMVNRLVDGQLETMSTRRKLGRRAHVHPVTIARLEAGVWPPTTRTVRQLAEALGVNPLELASPDEVAQREKEAAWPGQAASTCRAPGERSPCLLPMRLVHRPRRAQDGCPRRRSQGEAQLSA